MESERGKPEEEWDYEGILERLEVNPATRRRLQEEGIPAQALVAWWLQALTMKKVDPLRVALARCLDPASCYAAGEPFAALARAPGQLRRVLRDVASGKRYTLPCDSDISPAPGSIAELWDASAADPIRQAFLNLFGMDQSKALWLLEVLFGESWEFCSATGGKA